MNSSIGVIIVDGQFASRPTCKRSSAAVATRLSHSALRCGSSASVFSVRMPCTLSTNTLLLADSACCTRPIKVPIGLRKIMMITAINPAPTITIQASVAFIQNRNGKRNTSVKVSRNVPIRRPVTNSRTR